MRDVEGEREGEGGREREKVREVEREERTGMFRTGKFKSGFLSELSSLGVLTKHKTVSADLASPVLTGCLSVCVRVCICVCGGVRVRVGLQ